MNYEASLRKYNADPTNYDKFRALMEAARRGGQDFSPSLIEKIQYKIRPLYCDDYIVFLNMLYSQNSLEEYKNYRLADLLMANAGLSEANEHMGKVSDIEALRRKEKKKCRKKLQKELKKYIDWVIAATEEELEQKPMNPVARDYYFKILSYSLLLYDDARNDYMASAYIIRDLYGDEQVTDMTGEFIEDLMRNVFDFDDEVYLPEGYYGLLKGNNKTLVYMLPDEEAIQDFTLPHALWMLSHENDWIIVYRSQAGRFSYHQGIPGEIRQDWEALEVQVVPDPEDVWDDGDDWDGY